MNKTEVSLSYHNGTRGKPMVNVKVRSDFREPRFWRGQDWTNDGMTPEWVEANFTDDQLQAWWDGACELGWDQAENDAREIFGPDVKVWSEGRMGGWCVVEGLPEVETWDAIMVSKWSRFAKWAADTADNIPGEMLSLIYLNVYLPRKEKNDAITRFIVAATSATNDPTVAVTAALCKLTGEWE